MIDRVLWISLQHRTSRHRHFGQQLAKLGHLRVQRLPAVDAAALRIYGDPGSLRASRTGEIGCYLSHLSAIQFAVMTGETILVLEDDAVLVDNFCARLTANVNDFSALTPLIRLTKRGDPSGGTAGYVVHGDRAAGVLDTMSRHRSAGMSAFFDEYGAALNVGYSRTALVTQNKYLPSDMSGGLKRSLMDASRESTRGKSWAQYGEDDIVAEFFNEVRGADQQWRPRFLEIGALDGQKDSNCYKLALDGWRGVAVEPNPYLFTSLHQLYRGSDVETVCALVSAIPGIRTLHLNDDGLATSSPDVFNRLKDVVCFPSHCHAAAVTPDELYERFMVPPAMQREEPSVGSFDFVSIDAEGMDAEILEHSEKLLTGTRLICVEKGLPGSNPDPDYEARVLASCGALGFTTTVAETHGNLILAREPK